MSGDALCQANTLSVSGQRFVCQMMLCVSGQCGDWRNWFTEQQSAELKGAYRVSVGAHKKTLQYGEDKSSWGADIATISKPQETSEL